MYKRQAVLDTNSDPTGIDFPIPGNDDARRSINLYCDLLKNTIKDAEKFIEKGPKLSYKENHHGLYLVQLKDFTSVGICGLLKRVNLDLPDIGFAILPDYRRTGFIYEASKAVIQDAKKRLLYDKIVAITSPNNNASINLLIKLGFRYKELIKIESDNKPTQLYTNQIDS